MKIQDLKRIIKEEVRNVLKESVKPINSYNKEALARLLNSIGFPTTNVMTQDRLLIVNFRTPLVNAQKFLDAYAELKEQPGTGMLPSIVSAKRVNDDWQFVMEA